MILVEGPVEVAYTSDGNYQHIGLDAPVLRCSQRVVLRASADVASNNGKRDITRQQLLVTRCRSRLRPTFLHHWYWYIHHEALSIRLLDH